MAPIRASLLLPAFFHLGFGQDDSAVLFQSKVFTSQLPVNDTATQLPNVLSGLIKKAVGRAMDQAAVTLAKDRTLTKDDAYPGIVIVQPGLKELHSQMRVEWTSSCDSDKPLWMKLALGDANTFTQAASGAVDAPAGEMANHKASMELMSQTPLGHHAWMDFDVLIIVPHGKPEEEHVECHVCDVECLEVDPIHPDITEFQVMHTCPIVGLIKMTIGMVTLEDFIQFADTMPETKLQIKMQLKDPTVAPAPLCEMKIKVSYNH